MTAPRARKRSRGGQGGTEPPLRLRRREQIVIERSTAGDSQHDIARDLGISQSAVSQIIRRVDERWARENITFINRQKAAEARKLDHVHREALRAWEASKQQKTRRRQRKTESEASGPGSVAEVVIDDSHGDPRFLETARRALADRARLWGPAPGASASDRTADDEVVTFTLTLGDERTAPRPLDEHGSARSDAREGSAR